MFGNKEKKDLKEIVNESLKTIKETSFENGKLTTENQSLKEEIKRLKSENQTQMQEIERLEHQRENILSAADILGIDLIKLIGGNSDVMWSERGFLLFSSVFNEKLKELKMPSFEEAQESDNKIIQRIIKGLPAPTEDNPNSDIIQYEYIKMHAEGFIRKD